MTDAASGELDAEFAALVDAFAERGLPPWHSLSVTAARTLEDDVFGDGGGPEMAAVREFAIDGPGGDVPVRAYRPPAETSTGDGSPGALVFTHGGVFVLGTLDSADDVCRELAARTGRVVFSVDYRLAPEHPFPAAVDDAYAVVEWAREYADAFGADPGCVGVAGTSAGGGIAAATALRAGHEGVPLDVQVLLYPMLSAESAFGAGGGLRESYAEHGDAALLSTADVAWGWEHYLRSPVDAHNPFAVPLRADDGLLAAAPPAVVATAGVDVLRDEAVAYADALADAGVPVTHAHYPTLAHGFCSVTDDVTLADDAFDDVAGSVADVAGVVGDVDSAVGDVDE
ncbi:alpha/beta hydrolase [Halorubellus sp. JP-L1]|uniref:alpha/beta hydrolase n=1 Tax=Halorubellus sp. JP-L1 TaxID=2715753 RepID=UPI00140CD435|nr:alpha/beta hydrolase [Halorubellus sp. JP-L1]NHN42090.1 alpha/beta hydrolase [Halorubellus sp. JP-L1]